MRVVKTPDAEAYERWVKEVLEPFLSKFPELRARFASTSGFDFGRLNRVVVWASAVPGVLKVDSSQVVSLTGRRVVVIRGVRVRGRW